jgi:hypothetical protein
MTKQIDSTLQERGNQYGAFVHQARIAQSLKEVFKNTPNWDVLADDQKEALDMFANKLGRILNGNPDFVDSWHDISGYATLVEKRLSGEIL